MGPHLTPCGPSPIAHGRSVAYFEAIAYASLHLPPTLVACSVALEPLGVSLIGATAFGHVTTPLERTSTVTTQRERQ